MKKRIVFWSSMIVMATVWACGGDSGGDTPAKMTPEQLGKAIADIYVKSITEAADLMDKKEDFGILKSKLEAYREEVIRKLVKLGRQREALEAPDRSVTDRHISMGLSTVPREDYDRYNQGYQFYAGKDRATGNLIAAFNIITQYANFDLLKKQNPGEAERLGIE